MLTGVNVYAAAFLASIAMLVLLLIVCQNQNITYYLLTFIMITISNMGYYSLATAKNLDTALLGHRLIYLGGVFIPIFLLFSTMKLCRMEVPKWIVTVLLVMSTVVLYFAFSVGRRNDYYKNVSLGNDNGMTYLIKEYGPMHKLFILLVFGSVLVTIGIILYSFFTNKNVPYRVTFYMMLIELITIACYVERRISGMNFELTAIAYIFDEILILALIRRISKYEIMESVANSLDEGSTHGYIAFDENRRYVSCNDMAKEYLPELEKQSVDTYLDKDKVPLLYEQFGEVLNRPRIEETNCQIESAGRVLECSLKVLHPGKSEKIDGYLIEMIDDTQHHKYLRLLNNYNDDLAREVQRKTEYVNRLQERMVLGMADIIENRDTNTGGHVKRTSEVIRIFTEELKKCSKEYGFTEDFLRYITKAAPMHDLGKIAVDDRILRKPGKFTPEEFEEMKKHSEKGAEIVAKILEGVEDEGFVGIAENIAHYHHEKWNGQGYPDKLSGIDIPPEARIMALADVFDALVSKRCYKEKMDYDQAFEIIEESLGSHFDPEVGKLFLKCRPQLEAYYDSIE